MHRGTRTRPSIGHVASYCNSAYKPLVPGPWTQESAKRVLWRALFLYSESASRSKSRLITALPAQHGHGAGISARTNGEGSAHD